MKTSLNRFKQELRNLRQQVKRRYAGVEQLCQLLEFHAYLSALSLAEIAADKWGVLPPGVVEGESCLLYPNDVGSVTDLI